MALKQQKSYKNAILIIFLIFLIIFIIRIVFFAVPASQRKIEEKPVDYKEFMRLALIDYEGAQSALIYKDTGKATKLLEKSKSSAEKINDPGEELYGEAQKLLEQIKEKEAEVERAVAETENK